MMVLVQHNLNKNIKIFYFMLCKELEAAKKLVLSVESEAGVKTVIDELIEVTKSPKPGMRKVNRNDILRPFKSSV